MNRIQDLRIQQALDHRRIVGLSQDFAEEVAAAADVLPACRLWSDLTFAAEAIIEWGAVEWAIPLSGGWFLVFQWIEPFGVMEMRLAQEEYDE